MTSKTTMEENHKDDAIPATSPESPSAAAAADDDDATTGGLFAGLKLSKSRDEYDSTTPRSAVEKTPIVSNRTLNSNLPLAATTMTASKIATNGVVDLPPPPPSLQTKISHRDADHLLGQLKLQTESATIVEPEIANHTTGDDSEKKEEEETGAAAPAPATGGGGIFAWFSGGGTDQVQAAIAATEPTDEVETESAAAATEATSPVVEEETAATASPPEAAIPANSSEDDGVLVNETDAATEVPPPESPPSRREMTEEEQRELDAAFQSSTPQDTADFDSGADVAPHAGRLTIDPETPVPHADVCLKLLRKFAHKTRPKVLAQYGGSLHQSLISYYLFTSARDIHQQEITFGSYRQLLDCIFEHGEDRNPPHADHDDEESEQGWSASSSSRLPVDASTTARAGAAVAAFIDLFSTWGHASSALLERKDRKAQQAFADLQVAIFNAASNLVAYGCLDQVQIQMNNHPHQDETLVASQMLAQSVFNCDLSLERVELAAVKFLLGAGCRQNPSLLRGSHLLQAIRTLYHIYLTTESKSNKTTARAALQQLVTSVFTKVVDTDLTSANTFSDKLFPSDNHRDAFLVLRSICKLSMRTLPDQESGMHSHIGLQTSASNDAWDGDKMAIMRSSSERHSYHGGGSGIDTPTAKLVSTSAIHPALESKLLALELILYVLQRTPFSVEFVQHCGAQFQSAIRNYLCVSLLKNCTSDNTRVVSLSLRIFVPVVRNFRTVLKTEIEAFVTNVFFVILDSKNSPAEHKSIVINTFNEICSDPTTLAEIFLNYDCDLSAVDLFYRIVNTLSRLSRTGLHEASIGGWMGGPSEAVLEKLRTQNRGLRLDAMRALRQILASLHASIVEPLPPKSSPQKQQHQESPQKQEQQQQQQSWVEIYGSKKKRRAEESEAILRFNQKPSAGIAYAAKCQHLDADDPVDVARYLLKHKDELDKTQIGEYLGREAEYQNGFSLRVLHEYARLMDFSGLVFDDAIRFFLSGFRLPGEAQKIDRIMEKFAERFTEQNPEVFPSADVAFILSFSIIMLNTDLHNPAIKEERRMTKEGFVRNNRGICDGQDLPEELLTSIFDRIKASPISLKEDDEARERTGDAKPKIVMGLPAALSPASFFASHYTDADRARETNFQKERDHIVRTTESLLKRRRHSGFDNGKLTQKSRTGKSFRQNSSTRFVLSADSGLREEYVSPMFEVAWGPALAAFSTAMESANGTVGTLISIASDGELEQAAENAAETIEVCLTGFRFAIGTAGLCANSIARDAYMLALSRFSQLGTGVLLEPRHLRCVQTMLSLAREDGELLGGSWEHVFKALSEINRFHQIFHLMARNDRAAALAAERRKKKLQEKEERRQAREQRKAAAEDGESISDVQYYSESDSEDDDSLAESDLFTDDEDFDLVGDSMDAKAIDEANAREVYDAVSEATIEAIYERSSSLSATAVKEFVVQLCLVSRAEISVGNNNQMDLNQVAYRQKHELLASHSAGEFHHTQPNIYNLQKLVEVTHYNMTSRPRLIFADIWVTVADHLTYTALHPNTAIAMYAVDSFRQLCIQYLQKDELEVFEFQRRFLKPLESVMARSTQTSTKELLLNCVSRLMHVFGTESPKGTTIRKTGGLRSGWVPLLTILGLGGSDVDASIAQMSFKILGEEIEQCLNDEKHPGVLLTEHFVETVNALLLIVGSPHRDISLSAMGKLVTVADALADGKVSPLWTKRKASSNPAPEQSPEDDSKQRLELWWPILLGLSRSIGDARFDVRSKALESMFAIINGHFLPSESGDASPSVWETLQLIFRGVLNSIVEFAETSSDDGDAPGLPDDFELILNEDKKRVEGEKHEESTSSTWLETTFDSFMDECIDLCMRSMKYAEGSSLIDEVFALLNSCIISDSGALAVRGLRRLEQFLTSDLDASALTDDVWATVSHMLQKCLTVRGLPKRRATTDLSEEQVKEMEAEFAEEVEEFIAEDQHLSYRRYVGSNATMVVGLLLTSERFSIGLRWRIFLIKWLNRGVREWDSAAEMLTPNATSRQPLSSPRPPDYRETALYGRKWINRLVLQLASIKEIAEAPPDSDLKSNRFTQGQKQVIEVTEGMLLSFVEKEDLASRYHHSNLDEVIYNRYIALVNELLAGYGNMDSEYLQKMSWISPVLLSSCIRSKNTNIRLMVQRLVSRTSADSTSPSAYPPPFPKSEMKKGSEHALVEESKSTASIENGSETKEADSTEVPEVAKPNGTAAETTA